MNKRENAKKNREKDHLVFNMGEAKWKNMMCKSGGRNDAEFTQ